MSPGPHLIMGWLAAVPFFKKRRERAIIAWSGVAPDLDGLGIVVDWINGFFGKETFYFHHIHHYAGHHLIAAIVISGVAAALAKQQKGLVALFAFAAAHLHILCDIVGSRGPDGDQWPIYYFYPLNADFSLTWSGQWALNGWQNFVIAAALALACIVVIKFRAITPLELLSARLENEAHAMHQRYRKPKG